MGFFTLGTGADAAKSSIDSGKQLQGEAWNIQKGYLSQVRGALDQYLSGNVGFDPKQLALLKSQLLNSVAKNYGGANSAVRTAIARSGGGGGPMGGDAIRPLAALEGGAADAATSGIAGVDLQNLQQALMNRFNAAGIMSDNARTVGSSVNTFTGQINNGVDAYTNAIKNGFGAHFMSNLGDTLGSGYGKAVTGGMGTAGGR